MASLRSRCEHLPYEMRQYTVEVQQGYHLQAMSTAAKRIYPDLAQLPRPLHGFLNQAKSGL